MPVGGAWPSLRSAAESAAACSCSWRLKSLAAASTSGASRPLRIAASYAATAVFSRVTAARNTAASSVAAARTSSTAGTAVAASAPAPTVRPRRRASRRVASPAAIGLPPPHHERARDLRPALRAEQHGQVLRLGGDERRGGRPQVPTHEPRDRVEVGRDRDVLDDRGELERARLIGHG